MMRAWCDFHQLLMLFWIFDARHRSRISHPRVPHRRNCPRDWRRWARGIALRLRDRAAMVAARRSLVPLGQHDQGRRPARLVRCHRFRALHARFAAPRSQPVPESRRPHALSRVSRARCTSECCVLAGTGTQRRINTSQRDPTSMVCRLRSFRQSFGRSLERLLPRQG